MRLESNFLQQPRLLLAAGFPDFLVLLVTVLRIVQNLADRWIGLRSDLDQILAPGARQSESFRESLDTYLRSVRVNEPDLAGRDPVVDPRRVFGSFVNYCGTYLPFVALPFGCGPVGGINVSTFAVSVNNRDILQRVS
jgi:hypothetical protein